MPPASLTRRVRFAAAHRYRRPEWSDARNAEVFGALCAPDLPRAQLHLRRDRQGEIDPETGFIIDLGRLDQVLATEVGARFDHRNINLDVPEFADGRLVPTGENLARFIYERLQGALGSVAVVRVRIAEDETLSATFPAE